MSRAGNKLSRQVIRVTSALVAGALAAALAAGQAARPTPPPTRPATRPTPALGELYPQARKAFDDRQDREYEKAAAAIIARGDEAVEFLVARLDAQAERVGNEKEIAASGIRVTINLLGRMNSFPEARIALTKLQAHPVELVGNWARYALARQPQTQPATRPTIEPTATQPVSRRIIGSKIYVDEGWFAKPKVEPPKLPEKVTNAFVIELREEITSKTFDALKRKAVRCKRAGAELIILDMDTWGGSAISSMDIARLLKFDLKRVRTVCYVRTRAVSGGALVALACNEIVMTPVGKLGDCAPLLLGEKLEGVAREKIETVLRTEFTESAEKNGYNVALAESMVTIGREVWLIRNIGTRELRYVRRRDWRGRVRISPGVASDPSDERSEWELLRVEVPDGELLTMTSRQALDYGFVSRLIPANDARPLDGVLEHYKVVGRPTVLKDNWSERLVEFLTAPAMVGFLLFLGMLCAYVEINTPGFGVPGAVAILCFAILFSSSYLTGLATWWEIAVFVLGVGLLLAEIFVTPGFGVLGVGGILCCTMGLLAMLVPNPSDRIPWPDTTLDWEVFQHGAMALVVGTLLAAAGAALVARYLPKVPIAGRMTLPPPQVAEAPPATEDATILAIRPGQTGEVVQICRPVGKVRVRDRLVDAIADGAFLNAGTRVVVLRNEGNRIVVEEKA